MKQEKRENQINWFSIIRVVATLMIVTVHFGQSLPFPRVLHIPILFCQTAVCIFFILTGYFTELSLEHSKSTKDYYRKRIARIIPVYYSVILVNILASLLIGNYPGDVTHLGWLRFFTFIQGIIPSNDFSYWNNGAALWTMSGFCIYYICAPYLHKFLKQEYQRTVVLMGGTPCYSIRKIINGALRNTERLF